MSPEARAKEIMARLRQDCADAICTYLDCPSCGCMSYLAQSIREAEDAALERVRRLALNQVKFASDDWGQGHSVAAAGIANAIGALKHERAGR